MASIEDYSRAAQFAQYLQYKSLFEAYAPSDVGVALRRFPVEGVEPRAHLPGGALYDWYLAANGGYWGTRAGLAGGGPVRAISNLRDWTIHATNAAPIAASATSVKWSVRSLEGALLAGGEIPIPAVQIDGDSAARLEGSPPWVDASELSLPNPHGPQDVVLYRSELSYVRYDG